MKNKIYWEQYYANNNTPVSPSLFAIWCEQFLPRNSLIVDLGCGNGRDSLYFAKHNHNVIAIDYSQSAIKNLIGISSLIKPIFGDIENIDLLETHPNAVYARWLLHAITPRKEKAVLKWSAKALNNNGLLLIEARSDQENLSSRNHYCRQINSKVLIQQLQQSEFFVDQLYENRGFSPMLHNNPILIRVVAKKKGRESNE